KTYTSQMLGATATTRMFHEVSRATGKEVVNFDQLKNIVARELDDAGFSKTDGAARAELKRLEATYKIVMGLPLHDRETYTTVLDNIRAFNFLRVGPFMVAQLSELAQTVGEIGMRAAIQQV